MLKPPKYPMPISFQMFRTIPVDFKTDGIIVKLKADMAFCKGLNNEHLQFHQDQAWGFPERVSISQGKILMFWSYQKPKENSGRFRMCLVAFTTFEGSKRLDIVEKLTWYSAKYTKPVNMEKKVHTIWNIGIMIIASNKARPSFNLLIYTIQYHSININNCGNLEHYI